VGVPGNAEAEFEDILIAADRALYNAKAAGRDRVCAIRATDAISLETPDPSLAARAADVEALPTEDARATPASAFAAARLTFLMGRRLDMDVLAGELGVSREELVGWCGDRDDLLGEVLASLSVALVRSAAADQRDASGVTRFLAIYRQYVRALVNARPLQIFLREEPQAALQILTSTGGHVHPRTLRAVHELLLEEQRAGSFTARTDVRSLAYAIVRLTEAFLYHDTALATEPQIERAARVVALLLD